MDVTTFKLVAFVTIFLVGISGGLFAKYLSTSSRSEFYFSSGNAFAGGIFLGAGLIHMLPDAQQGFHDVLGHSDYPWFAVACALGFLFILFLEKVLFSHDHHTGTKVTADVQSDKFLYPYILMLVLSIHSIITGIALGTESRIAQAAVILIAVLAHKGTASFALAISMLRSRIPPRQMAGLIVCFSLMTPLGIASGYFFMLLLSGRAEAVFEAVFDALAAGTFLYIALLDILEEEFRSSTSHRMEKFFLVLAGFGLMALVAIWT